MKFYLISYVMVLRANMAHYQGGSRPTKCVKEAVYECTFLVFKPNFALYQQSQLRDKYEKSQFLMNNNFHTCIVSFSTFYPQLVSILMKIRPSNSIKFNSITIILHPIVCSLVENVCSCINPLERDIFR